MRKVLVRLKKKMNNKFLANRYVPKYCDKNLKWFDRNYDFVDINRWEDFEKNSDQYIKNVKIVSFDKIYRSIGFKPINNSLVKFRKLTSEELSNFKPLRQYQTVDSKMVDKIPQPKKSKAVAACIRSDRKDIFVTKLLCLIIFCIKIFGSLFENLSKLTSTHFKTIGFLIISYLIVVHCTFTKSLYSLFLVAFF